MMLAYESLLQVTYLPPGRGGAMPAAQAAGNIVQRWSQFHVRPQMS